MIYQTKGVYLYESILGQKSHFREVGEPFIRTICRETVYVVYRSNDIVKFREDRF